MKRKFMFTESDAESDAESEGYMAPRHTQNAVALFMPANFARRGADLDAYTKILNEVIEFLYARRK